MNREILGGNWQQCVGWVIESWGVLSGNPRVAGAGAHERHIGRNQVRYGVAKQNAANQLKDFLHRNRDWDPSSD